MFEFNYSVGDIKNSELGEGIVCLGEGCGVRGEGSGGKGGGKWGKRGREVGVRGEGSGECLPPCPPPQRVVKVKYSITEERRSTARDRICHKVDCNVDKPI